jgi:hypothetical protein
MSKPLVLLLTVLSVGFVFPASNGRLPAASAGPSPSFDVREVVGQVRERALAAGSTNGSAILISRAYDAQTYPSLAYNDDDDEWLAVWHDNRDGDYDIYGQRVDRDGMIVGEVIAVWESSDDLFNPGVAYDTKQKRYFVVWENSGSTKAIEGRVLGADGGFVTGKVDVTTGTKARTHPAVAYNAVANQYLVVWDYEEAADNHDTWARKIKPDGSTDGGTYQINTDASDEIRPALIAYPASSGGRYLLVWSGNHSGTYNIIGRRLDSAGAVSGNAFGISLGTDEGTGNEFLPDLALDRDEDLALVVWDYQPASGDQSIYGRLIDINNMANPRGTWLAISDGAGDQYAPAVTYNDAAGEYLVVWDDGNDLFGQRVDGDASAVAQDFVISQAPNAQWFGAVAFGGDRYLAVWGDYRSAGPDIFGQFVSQAGELLGDEIGLSPAFLNQQFPALAYGSAQQQWLVVWEDDHTGLRGITGQFMTHGGLLVGEPFTIGAHVNGQYSPAVAYNPDDDEFMVVWDDWRNLNHDIYGQRVKASDGSVFPEVQITSNPDWQWTPALAYDGDAGQYLVVWSDNRNDPGDDSNWDIFGKRLKQDGTPWDGFALDICKRQDNQEHPAMAYNPQERQYLVVWEDSSLYGRGIAGQRIGDGSTWRVDPDNFDICSGDAQLHPSVACNTAVGEYLVVWDNGDDIYGQRLAGDRSLLGSAFAVSNAPGMQRYPRASYDLAHDGYYVCWEDNRIPSASWDIYCQHLSGGGGLLFTAADTNMPVWTYTGMQEYPAAAQDPADGRGLIVWQDKRNGTSPRIYGRLEDAGGGAIARVYLPIVLRNQ